MEKPLLVSKWPNPIVCVTAAVLAECVIIKYSADLPILCPLQVCATFDFRTTRYPPVWGEIFTRYLIELSVQQEMHIWVCTRECNWRLAPEKCFISPARHTKFHTTLIAWKMDPLKESVWNTDDGVWPARASRPSPQQRYHADNISNRLFFFYNIVLPAVRRQCWEIWTPWPSADSWTHK